MASYKLSSQAGRFIACSDITIPAMRLHLLDSSGAGAINIDPTIDLKQAAKGRIFLFVMRTTNSSDGRGRFVKFEDLVEALDAVLDRTIAAGEGRSA